MLSLLLLACAAASPLLPPEPPVSLTASDGSGLAIVRYDVDSVVAGPLAFTELRLVFKNPHDRVIEGRFNLTLPDGAAVSRFAMKIDGRFQEGEVVEKQAARRAYEDALHRRQDPALLEQASPNAFSARVFPIPARGEKEIVVAWSEELAGRPWRLALRGLPELGSFAARVRVGSTVVFQDARRHFVPAADIALPPTVSTSATLRSDEILVTKVTALSSTTSAALPLEPTLILLDTSASRALGEQADRQLVADLAAKWAATTAGAAVPLVVVGFDQTTTTLFDGAFGPVTLAPRRALGATNLGTALSDATSITTARGLKRVILVGDGLVTAGDDVDALVAGIKRLASVGVHRVDAVAVGGLRDNATLRRLVAGVLRDEGAVIDGAAGAAAVLARLVQPARSGLDVVVEGATWTWPRRLDGVQPGDEVIVVAELPPHIKPVLRIGGAVVALPTVQAAPAPLLRRAWALAKINRLLEARTATTEPGARAEIAEQIVAVSTKHRVLSPLTAMIVLETEADYARFGIARTALSDILVVDDTGVHLAARSDFVVRANNVPVQPAEPPKAKKTMSKAAVADEAPAENIAREGEAEEGGDDDDMVEENVEENEDEYADEAPSSSSSAPAPGPAMAAAPTAAPPPPPPPVMDSDRRRQERRASVEAVSEVEPERSHVAPDTGPFAEVMKLVAGRKLDEALRRARGWREEDKGDLLALLALGEVLEAQGNVVEAARAYGSLIDLFADRADIRRLAGARLDRLARRAGAVAVDAAALLAEDTWRRAAQDRPDHPQGARGWAWALVRLGRYEQAFAVIEAARSRGLQDGRFNGVDEILNDDLGLIGAAWLKASAAQAAAIRQRLSTAAVALPEQPSTRFVLWWETDANDVDFHIHDGQNNHAWYSSEELSSGGRLYADVTTGFGPECFTIEGTATAFPYTLEAHYYSRGPMGFGMGSLRIVQHDGKGGLLVEDRPFVIMVDGAFVDLGTVTGPLR
jgi:hypothetical protein